MPESGDDVDLLMRCLVIVAGVLVAFASCLAWARVFLLVAYGCGAGVTFRWRLLVIAVLTPFAAVARIVLFLDACHAAGRVSTILLSRESEGSEVRKTAATESELSGGDHSTPNSMAGTSILFSVACQPSSRWWFVLKRTKKPVR